MVASPVFVRKNKKRVKRPALLCDDRRDDWVKAERTAGFRPRSNLRQRKKYRKPFCAVLFGKKAEDPAKSIEQMEVLVFALLKRKEISRTN